MSGSRTRVRTILILGFKKSKFVNHSHNSSSIRAFYFSLELPDLFSTYNPQDFNLELATYLSTNLRNLTSIKLDNSLLSQLTPSLDIYKLSNENLKLEVDFYLSKSFSRILQFQFSGKEEVNMPQTIYIDLIVCLKRTLFLINKLAEKRTQLDLASEIKRLRVQLPRVHSWDVIQKWGEENGEAFYAALCAIAVKYLNIGHDWQFTEAQKEKLQQYYDANKLLVDCLNSDCYVTKATRQYIEDTLLLPMSEIEKIPVPNR